MNRTLAFLTAEDAEVRRGSQRKGREMFSFANLCVLCALCGENKGLAT